MYRNIYCILKSGWSQGGIGVRRTFFLSALLLIVTAALPLLAVGLPAQEAALDAEIRLTVRSGGGVTETTMAEWLPGVVAAEMPASFEPEALKAQAVAARTFLLEHRQNRPENHPNADVCDDPACCCAHKTDAALKESWGGDAGKNLRRIRSAVQETDGQILTYQGEPILAAFHASSSGKTEDSAALWGAVPYLVSVSTPETEADVPGFQSSVTFSPDELKAAILTERPEAVFPEDPAMWLGAAEPDAGGRVGSITIAGETFSGAALRRVLNLRSAAFTAEYADGSFTFTVTGHGHGVGMSQYGANVMAKQGSDYAEILAHYYPGTELASGER